MVLLNFPEDGFLNGTPPTRFQFLKTSNWMLHGLKLGHDLFKPPTKVNPRITFHRIVDLELVSISIAMKGGKSTTELHLSDLEDFIVLGCCNKIDMKTTSGKSFEGVLLTLIKTEGALPIKNLQQCTNVIVPQRLCGATFTIILQGQSS